MAMSTDLSNLALLHLGIQTAIGDIDTENTANARAIRKVYNYALKEILSAAEWPFATKFADLNLIEEDPVDEWSYSYTYPSDCVHFRRIVSGNRVDTESTRIAFRVVQDGEARLIYTDQEDAESEYTCLIENEAVYPPVFVMAFTYLLASYVAPAITGGDPFKLEEKCRNKYMEKLSGAAAREMNESPDEVKPEYNLVGSRN